MLVVVLHIIGALFTPRPVTFSDSSSVCGFIFRHFMSARAAVVSVSKSYTRQFVGGLAGVVLMCIGSFSNSFVEAEAAVAMHAHVIAGTADVATYAPPLTRPFSPLFCICRCQSSPSSCQCTPALCPSCCRHKPRYCVIGFCRRRASCPSP